MRSNESRVLAVAFLFGPLAACGDDSGGSSTGDGGATGTTGQTSSVAVSVAVVGVNTSVGSGTTQGSTGEGGGTGGSSTSDGGASSTSDGGSTSQGGSGGGTLTGVGGGVVDVACDNGCVPYPSDGSGGAGGNGSGGGLDADCDDDGDPNLTDCQPCDPLVFHGQLEFFDVAYTPFEERAAPSFDYDCSGSATTEYEYFSFGCDDVAVNDCDGVTIYVSGEDPLCGETHSTQDCHVTGIVVTTCSNDGPTSSMLVRCH